jgi:hypothetical protein
MKRLAQLAVATVAVVAYGGPATASFGTGVTSTRPAAAVAATCPTAAAPAALDAWRDMWSGVSGGWVAGDGGWSVRHPTDGSYLFAFGDTAIVDSHGQRKMPHGTAVSWRGSQLAMVSGDGSFVPEPGDAEGSYYWPGPLLVENGRLYSFASHMRGGAGVGRDLAEFDWPACGAPRYRGTYATPSSGRPGKVLTPAGPISTIEWGAAVLKLGSYWYVYGTMHQDGWFGSRVYIARAPVGQLTNLPRWQYWDSQTWSIAREASAAPIVGEVRGPESSFSVDSYGGLVKITSKADGAYGSDVTRWVGAQPQGPFTTSVVGQSPWRDWDQTYLYQTHYDLPTIGGRILTSVSHGRACRPNPGDTDCQRNPDGSPVQTTLGDFWDHPEWFRLSWDLMTP